MKIAHLSDLHLGKIVNDFSMLEDQEYILKQILEIVENEGVSAVLISGDIYDKSVPSAQSVALFDSFLVSLKRKGIKVLGISGNHDCAERIGFGESLMDESGVHFSPVFSGKVKSVALDDEFGKINFYLLPFIKPVHVRKFYPDTEISTYNQALKTVVDDIDIDPTQRNVLLTHQFVTGARQSESEEISVGGTENVDSIVFDKFDYVALGHLHAPQSVGRETLRYCGTPLKYSFSESGDQKSVSIVEFLQKGEVNVYTVDLIPKRDMKVIKGSYLELTAKSFYENLNTDDYFRVILTDELDVVDAAAKLRIIYPNIMRLDYENTRTKAMNVIDNTAEIQKDEFQLFCEFYQLQNNVALTSAQEDEIKEIIETLKGECK